MMRKQMRKSQRFLEEKLEETQPSDRLFPGCIAGEADERLPGTVRLGYELLLELLLELSFGQWCVLVELPPDEPLLLVALGEGVDFVAANACPTPTPPNRVPAAMVVATTARRMVTDIERITSSCSPRPAAHQRNLAIGRE